jgi:hypothetical protein
MVENKDERDRYSTVIPNDRGLTTVSPDRSASG